MKKHTLALLASLLVVVFLSGCTFPGVGPARGAATGVIIKSFAPDISEIFSEDDVTFSLSVENVGGEDAYNVQARLFGLGTDWEFLSDKLQEIGYLERSQPEYKVPGGIGDAQWDITSPPGLKVDNTYTASTRLTYSYRTTALANIKIYDSEYLRSNPEDAESIMKSSGIESFTVTNAPITVELAGLARPLIKRAGTQEASITVLLDNIGQGKPYDSTENDMTITVVKVKAYETTCVRNQSVRLPRSGKKSVPCRFELPDVEEFTTLPLEVELSYNYFLDDTTSIKVLKSLFIGEEPTYSCTAGDHSECCWNEDGPCGKDKGAQCDDDGRCHCGSTYEDYYICPKTM